MPIRKTVFGSAAERHVFEALKGPWSTQFDLWPNLPLLMILDVSQGKLSPREWETIKKMSVDFTLCTKEGTPVISIEFDGLGHGFSREGKYIEIARTDRDPYRKLKIDLKLRVASMENYPLMVLSYPETTVLGPGTQLMIAHGIIGQVLSRRRRKELLQSYVDEHPGFLDGLTEWEKSETVQDLVLDAETQAELELDPIADLASRLSFEAQQRGLVKSFNYHWVHDPPGPDFDFFTDGLDKLKARIAAVKSAARVGCCFEVKTPTDKFSRTAWARNFDGIVDPATIVREVAELITFDEVLRQHRREPGPASPS